MLLLISGSGHAAHDDFTPVLFSLHMTHIETTLRYPDLTADTDIDHLTLSFTEAVHPFLEGRIALGPVSVDQFNQPLTQGLILNGSTIGFQLRLHSPRDRPVSGFLAGGYHYTATADRNATQEVELRWHEVEFEAGPRLQWSQTLALELGGTISHLEGTQSASGAVNQTLGFRLENQFSSFARLSFATEQDGWIELAVYRQARRGITISFSRLF